MPGIEAKKPRKCRRCGGLAPYAAVEGVFKCGSCGHEEMDRVRRHGFLESHKKEIIQDILTIGATKTRAKWGLPLPSFYHLTSRWGLRQAYSAPGISASSTNGLPKLPAWREEWSPEFKMKWMETYQSLAAIKEKGDGKA